MIPAFLECVQGTPAEGRVLSATPTIQQDIRRVRARAPCQFPIMVRNSGPYLLHAHLGRRFIAERCEPCIFIVDEEP